jgi:hypothetical protein
LIAKILSIKIYVLWRYEIQINLFVGFRLVKKLVSVIVADKFAAEARDAVFLPKKKNSKSSFLF